jgi:hypothetical protein
MAEMSTSENEELIAQVYTQALEDRLHGRKLAAADLMVYHIEMLSQEVNSGASFEQYFRWASCEEISEAVGRLESVGLDEVAGIVRRAINEAFPAGIPSDGEQKDELTDWTEDQEQRLSALFEEFEEFNGRIMNVLAAYYRSAKP